MYSSLPDHFPKDRTAGTKNNSMSLEGIILANYRAIKELSVSSKIFESPDYILLKIIPA